jgi:hypothetical protein
MTPSEAVDQAWHLHLTYTRSYWEDLCGTVLEWPLHHGPTKGGPEGDRRYHEQYAATLEAYRLAFGEPPPDIWPDVETRFRQAGRMRFVDTSEVWLLPKRPPAGLLVFLKPLHAVTMVGALAAMMYAGFNNLGGLAFLAWCVLFIGLAGLSRPGGRSRRRSGSSGGVDFGLGCSGADGGGCGGCGS